MATIYTIGHSTHSQETFQQMLAGHGIRYLIDIRRYPGSRRYPQFSKDTLSQWLPKSGIDYIHEMALGGRRTPAEDSPNTFWRNAQFRAYADYMATPEFKQALERVLDQARLQPTAIMCAEAVPWRCHRNLVADALTAKGHDVLHIMSTAKANRHVMNEHAQIDATGAIVYQAGPSSQQNLF
jgi:uncharacterized protein (DUF488 family)